jgi:hypothetical protein|tara:strand:+ start:142 stop:243 length:102 start_codon:yes stop_codon:yes gene_type:complete
LKEEGKWAAVTPIEEKQAANQTIVDERSPAEWV